MPNKPKLNPRQQQLKLLTGKMAQNPGLARKSSLNRKMAEQARRKAERDALLEEETSNLPSKPTAAAKKAGPKAAASRNTIDRALGETTSTLSASNIEDAIGALELSNKSVASRASDIDRHPERRFKAALLAYEERRLPELREEHKGLRLQQYKELIFKEFQKSDQNPKNQVFVYIQDILSLIQFRPPLLLMLHSKI